MENRLPLKGISPRCAAMTRHLPVNSALFQSNRDRLRALLPQNSLVVVNANDIPPTNADAVMIPVPNSDLFYLSGVAQEESILVICPDAHEEKHREILFLRETSEHIAVWEGYKLTKEQATKVSGIRTIMRHEEFPVMMRRLMCERKMCSSIQTNTRAPKSLSNHARPALSGIP
jgi:Xaa-Pro aminopeptidase